jgi:hypothetical protein
MPLQNISWLLRRGEAFDLLETSLDGLAASVSGKTLDQNAAFARKTMVFYNRKTRFSLENLEIS